VNYFDAFKRVRNRIRKHDAGKVVLACITRLHSPDAASVERMRFQPPWVLLLLIKWAIVHGDFSSYGKRPLTDNELNYLIRMMHEVDDAMPLPSTDLTVLRIMRPIAYQQVWHQQETFPSGFARQALLFGALPSSHVFEQWFKDETGVSIGDFLELALMGVVQFFQPTNHYFEEAQYFQNVAHSFPPTAIPNFLRSVGKTPGGVRQYLLSVEQERKSGSSEFREVSPLIKYPLLNLAGRYYYYSRRLLTYSIETFVYDTLRGRDPSAFMDRFGGLFQKYIHTALEFSGLKFLDENEISQFLKDTSKRVDFLIAEPGANVLVDAKGVEVGHLGMTSFYPDIVTDKVKSSVVKGIQQGMDTVMALRSSPARLNMNLERMNNFLLLVTYKDLLLGTGSDFYESFARGRLIQILGTDPANYPIPLEHIYIISAEEFDQFIAYAMSQKDRLAEIFKKVSARDANPATKSLFLFQYLQDTYGNVEPPAYLKNHFDEYGKRVGARLKR